MCGGGVCDCVPACLRAYVCVCVSVCARVRMCACGSVYARLRPCVRACASVRVWVWVVQLVTFRGTC